MERRKFGREFKIEAVRLVKERGVSVAQAARDLDVHENVLRKWIQEFASDPAQAFPGLGQMKPEQLEIDRLRREVAKLKAERDILKKAAAYFARESLGSSALSRSTVLWSRQASSPAHEPMAPAVSGGTCWPMAFPAACTRSSG
jgi:transposase